MIWMPLFLLFGLVSMEQGSIWPIGFVVVMWFVLSPKQAQWEREAGGHLFGPKFIFLLALLPFLYVVARDMGVVP